MHTPLYTETDYEAIIKQQRKRWLLLTLPCLLLLAVLLVALLSRILWLASVATILIGVLLIAGSDLLIKPLHCYELHLDHSLHGRTSESELPFLRLSENIDLVDGVHYRQLICTDKDGKGRPYERLFYFDAEKELPAIEPGTVLHITHHDLFVADLELV